MSAYYNEIDPFAAAWLRELIKQGHIAPGVVDERDLRDIRPDELREFTQCHFFAGVGVWSYALRRAGWPDDKPVWTGSCPCQPFSAAGRRVGMSDERHLWPHWYHLITQRRPDVVFGEQVASKDGLGWLDLVQADLEGAEYASGAVDLCAAGVGAPHIRQRLWFVGERLVDPLSDRLREGETGEAEARPSARWDVERPGTDECGELPSGSEGPGPECLRGVGDSLDAELQRHAGDVNYGCQSGRQHSDANRSTAEASGPSGMANTDGAGPQSRGQTAEAAGHGDSIRPTSGDGRHDSASPTNGFWRDADWLFCRDEKWRPVEPGTFPLAHGVTSRVGRLRGYGNAINAEVATTFIEAYLN